MSVKSTLSVLILLASHGIAESVRMRLEKFQAQQSQRQPAFSQGPGAKVHAVDDVVHLEGLKLPELPARKPATAVDEPVTTTNEPATATDVSKQFAEAEEKAREVELAKQKEAARLDNERRRLQEEYERFNELAADREVMMPGRVCPARDWLDLFKSGKVLVGQLLASTFIVKDVAVGGFLRKRLTFSSPAMKWADQTQFLSLMTNNPYRVGAPFDELDPQLVYAGRCAYSTEGTSKIWYVDKTIYVTFKFIENWPASYKEIIKSPVTKSYGGVTLDVNEWVWNTALDLWEGVGQVKDALVIEMAKCADCSVIFIGESHGGTLAQVASFMFAVDQGPSQRFFAVSNGGYRWLTAGSAQIMMDVMAGRLMPIITATSFAGSWEDPYPGFPGAPYAALPGTWRAEIEGLNPADWLNPETWTAHFALCNLGPNGNFSAPEVMGGVDHRSCPYSWYDHGTAYYGEPWTSPELPDSAIKSKAVEVAHFLHFTGRQTAWLLTLAARAERAC